MRRTMLLTTIGAAVATTVVPTLAATAPADSGRAADVTLVVPEGHGDVLQLELRAATLSTGNVLRIVAQHCDASGSCDGSDVYQSPLAASAFSVDSSTATAALKVDISGHDLQLRWRPDASAGTGGGGDAELGSDGVSDSEYEGDGADVTVSGDDAGCDTTGIVGTEVVVDTTGSADTADVSALRLPDDATIGCGQ